MRQDEWVQYTGNIIVTTEHIYISFALFADGSVLPLDIVFDSLPLLFPPKSTVSIDSLSFYIIMQRPFVTKILYSRRNTLHFLFNELINNLLYAYYMFINNERVVGLILYYCHYLHLMFYLHMGIASTCT